jgi:hypothetical protein
VLSRLQRELFDAAQSPLRRRIGELLRDEIEQRIRLDCEVRRSSVPGLNPSARQAAPSLALKGRQRQESRIHRAPGARRSLNCGGKSNSRALRQGIEVGTLRPDPGIVQQ